ncbi:MAG: hypothetical protein H6719_08450 [Sandaracinaceae bacterium]|nr:hypothetical protein [Sandaracinaceae bacterium]
MKRTQWAWLAVTASLCLTGCPSDEPDTDGGSPGTDAGPTGTDAGMMGVDSGMMVEDAGGMDAGGEDDAGPTASCTNGVMDGAESDVDCGGGTCPTCAEGAGCGTDADCASGTCDATTSTCGPSAMADCSNGTMDGDETDVDCGGSCDGCADGRMCATGSDCSSGSCDASTSTCAAATCTDGARNGAETDVDCGGGTCPTCADGAGCATGSDCTGGSCDASSMTCAAVSCTDGARNGDETDVDCGGATCGACADGAGCAAETDCTSGVCDAASSTCSAATCTDGVTNSAETDTDCGGGTCPTCAAGDDCGASSDCASGVCDGTTSTCSSPTCSDGVMNGAETGVDCGGGTCGGCADGGPCAAGADCASGVCDGTTSTCAAPTCTDMVMNGAETDADCGGGTCPTCADGDMCAAGTDCTGGICDATSSTCTSPSCTDGILNGAETGTDCGGGACPGCADGGPCGADGDCASGSCDTTSMTCATPTCTDGARNGMESDIDCGGGTCPACAPGEDCTAGTDCSSGICGGGSMTCNAPTCSDGVANGAETDVDCGGGTCGLCSDGDTCVRGSDCSGDHCVGRRCQTFRTCREILEGGGSRGDGMYSIDPRGTGSNVTVYCDMTGGGWTRIDYSADLPFTGHFDGPDNVYRYLPADFTTVLSRADITAIRARSTEGRQRYVGQCYHVIHWYYTGGTTYGYAFGFRMHDGTTTPSGVMSYAPYDITVSADGCRANDSVNRTTTFDINSVAVPVMNVYQRDGGTLGEHFGSQLTMNPAWLR